MKELHGEGVVVCEYGSQGLEPLYSKHQVDTTQRKKVQVHRELLVLNPHWDVHAELITAQMLAISHHDT